MTDKLFNQQFANLKATNAKIFATQPAAIAWLATL